MKQQMKSNPHHVLKIQKFFSETMINHFKDLEFIGKDNGVEVTIVGKMGVVGSTKKLLIENGKTHYTTKFNPALNAAETCIAKDRAEEWANIHYLEEVMKIFPIVKRAAATLNVHWQETTISQQEEMVKEALRRVKNAKENTEGVGIGLTAEFNYQNMNATRATVTICPKCKKEEPCTT